ncbi:glycosyltransferase family 2 protein [Lactobacillus sp. 0.1XD8-4]|nr:glycosyltransferase family 2 protein [uncultured Limosilactobacillus sp.]MRN07390.1 glycosyltransferase family 2 protein [Lactobacillus sp. 0.1XD8-4]
MLVLREKISVIVPVYNDEKYLKQCVESVLTQSYSNLEVILVDDGSTDNTPAICEDFREQDDRVRVIHKQNEGVGASRNTGIAMATGDYILFIDHDDWLFQDHIQKLYDLLKKNQADIAVANFSGFLEEKGTFLFYVRGEDYFEKNYTPSEWFEIEYEDKYNLNQAFVVPWGKLYKASLFKNIVYPTNTKVEDDLTTWKVYLLADKISYQNDPSYVHRIMQESVTGRVNQIDVYPLEAVTERLAMLKLLGIDTTNEERAYYLRLKLCRDNALKDGNVIKYRDALQKIAILQKFHKM